MVALCDHCIAAPSAETPLIQQIHIVVAHAICSLIEQDMFGVAALKAADRCAAMDSYPIMTGPSHSVGSPVTFPLAGMRVWVAGHRGMVGSALVRRLQGEDCIVLMVDRGTLDLRRQGDVELWVAANRPDVVFIAAATVGGIYANATRPAEFLYDNLAIAANIIQSAAKATVKKLMFLGAACIYPRLTSQPMTEDSLLGGPPEPTNESYRSRRSLL